MHTTSRRTTILALAISGLLTAGTSVVAAAPAPWTPTGTGFPAGDSILPRTVQAGLAVLITTRTVTPKVQRTVRFNGYATYTFLAPRGRRIVSASARIVGAQPHSVAIRRRSITRKRTRYTVSLIFPGEQGNPGKLVVRLGTVG